MKKVFSIIVAATLAVTVSAQQSVHENYVGVNFGGGLNTLLYRPLNGQQAVGAGFDAGIHYARFFNSWAGLGVGVSYSWANAYAKYNWSEVTTGLTHPSNPNTPYNLTTAFTNYVERQNVGIISIPVEALFRKGFNDRVALIGGVGLSLDLPVHGAYYAKAGSYSTSGVFPELGDYTVKDMPEHGFSTYTTAQNAKINNRAKVGGSVIADLGVRVAFNDNWGMYIGVNFGYGFTNILASAKTEEMLMINPTNPSVIDYRGTFDSNETGKVNPIRCGLKVAIDFGWPSARKEKERLAREQARQDSIAAAEAAILAEAARIREQARRDSIAAAEEAARLAVERAALDSVSAAQKAYADSIAAAQKAYTDSIAAAEKAKADSIAAVEAEKARLAAERAAHIAALKEEGETVTVHFDTGGDKLQFKEGEQAIIDEIAEVMQNDPSLKIVITGHTDNTGNEEQNLKVWGMKRAEALKNYMVSKGVPAEQISCESKGQTEPVADNATREGRAQNRRANIRFE